MHISSHCRCCKYNCLNNFNFVKAAGIAVGARAIVFNTLSERVSRKLRFDFYSSVIRQDLGFYDVRQTGKISKF